MPEADEQDLERSSDPVDQGEMELPDPPGAREVYLAEYHRLRDEVDNRTRLNYGFVALQLAAIGAAASVLLVSGLGR